MYVIYLVMYTILAFFILVNFFLAIVVESFMCVKRDIEAQVTENASPYDTLDIFMKIPLYLIYRWPRRGRIIAAMKEEGDLDHLQRLVEDNKDKVDNEIEYQGVVDANCLIRNFPDSFTAKSAEAFLKTYRRTVPDLEFEKFDQDNQRIMLEDLKDTMNKRKSILDEMRAPEEEMEAKEKANDIGALQHSISLLDQEIGMRQKELEMKTNDLRVKQKHIRDLKRRLNKMGDAHDNGYGNGHDSVDNHLTMAPSDRETTGLSSELGNGKNGKNGTNGTNGDNGSTTVASGNGSNGDGSGSNGSH
jgi:hypothetical protein